MKPVSICALIIGLAVPNVNPAAVSAVPSKLDELVRHLLLNGKNETVGPGLAPILGLTAGETMKSDGTDPEEATDGLDRNCYLVLDQSARPFQLVFVAGETHGADTLSRYFRAGLDGKLLQAAEVRGKNSADGSAKVGSAENKTISVASKGAQARFRHELDFWLKGMYRTKLGKLRMTNPNATMADVQAQDAKASGAAATK